MSTQTERLGLHQWEAEDPFLRSDFNEDLAKIDAGVAAAAAEAAAMVAALTAQTERAEPLRDVALDAPASQLDVDLTGIDWARYRRAEILIRGGGTERLQGRLRLNGLSSSDDYIFYRVGSDVAGTSGCLNFFEAGPSATRTTLWTEAEQVSGLTVQMGVQCSLIVSYMRGANILRFSDLKTLNLVPYSADTLPAGLRVTITGILA